MPARYYSCFGKCLLWPMTPSYQAKCPIRPSLLHWEAVASGGSLHKAKSASRHLPCDQSEALTLGIWEDGHGMPALVQPLF